MKYNELSYEEKYRAFMSCDTTYNYRFYTAVKTTGIFCLPSCKCKKPKEKNIEFYENYEDALKAGYRPCKVCRPLENNHTFNDISVKEIKKYIDDNYEDDLKIVAVFSIDAIAKKKLVRNFRFTYGITPKEYMIKVRINKSKKLLKNSLLSILDVGMEVGFNSTSNFYKHFKKLTGTTPKEYRDMEKANE